jgi:hypothetical protein
MPRLEIERLQVREDLCESSSETFDRLAFAERAIALVRPPKMVVAVGQGSRRVEVASGRRWSGEPDSRWGMLLVPPNASRRAIASAVLSLHGGSARPWALDVLMAELPEPA